MMLERFAICTMIGFFLYPIVYGLQMLQSKTSQKDFDPSAVKRYALIVVIAYFVLGFAIIALRIPLTQNPHPPGQ